MLLWYKICQLWLQSHPCKTKTSQETQEPTEVPGADKETKSHLHWQLLRIWQLLRKNSPVIFVRQHHTDQKRMRLLKEQCAWSEGRNICGYVAIRSGWKMVDGFHGVSVIAICETFKIFNGPVIPFGAMVEYHPISAKRHIETTTIWSKSLARNIPRLCIFCGEVDFSCTCEHPYCILLHFCPLFLRNMPWTLLIFDLIFVQPSIFQFFWAFFREGVRIKPHISFCFFVYLLL